MDYIGIAARLVRLRTHGAPVGRDPSAALDDAIVEAVEALREAQADADRLARALALTDTGSPEFREAFPPRSAGEGISPREIVPGWRVVERVREVLLG